MKRIRSFIITAFCVFLFLTVLPPGFADAAMKDALKPGEKMLLDSGQYLVITRGGQLELYDGKGNLKQRFPRGSRLKKDERGQVSVILREVRLGDYKETVPLDLSPVLPERKMGVKVPGQGIGDWAPPTAPKPPPKEIRKLPGPAVKVPGQGIKDWASPTAPKPPPKEFKKLPQPPLKAPGSDIKEWAPPTAP